MMNGYSTILITITTTFLLFSCNEEKSDKASVIRPLPPEQPITITTISLTSTDFKHELVSNGKIATKYVAELKFQRSEAISKIFVRNGSRVRKGDRIAMLDTYFLGQAFNQAKDALDRSKLEYQDVLIGQGFKINRTEAIPKDIDELAKVKSGYNAAQTQYDIASYNLKHATLTAPFDGTVANLFTKQNTLSSSSVFCNIIDTRSLEVTFSVLENELGLVQLHNTIEIIPFAMTDVHIEGRIAEINPWVDDKGMVNVKASVNYESHLVEGMNVRVRIFRSLGKQWVVPKSAVVSRTGKQVVFTLKDGKAHWNYVQKGMENANQCTITSETLKEGDQIIVSGNINLAHESPVKVVAEAKESEQ